MHSPPPSKTRAQVILDQLERGETNIESALAAFDDRPEHSVERKKLSLSRTTNTADTSSNATQEQAPRRTKIVLEDVNADRPKPSVAGEELVELVELVVDADGVAFVTMRNDAASNMLSAELLAGLREKFAEIETRASEGKAKVVVITGTETWFCCGGTFDDLARMRDGRATFLDVDGFRLLLDCSLPTIAAMHGHAIGGGFTFGLYADVALLADSAFYSANFMEHGLTPGIGTTYLLKKKLGEALGTELMLTARRYQGRDLKARGISLEVLDEKEMVLARAFEIAREIAKHPLQQIKLLKRHGTEETRRALPRVLREEDSMHERCFPRRRRNTPTKKEGAYATLLVERGESFWSITLHRPDARNAIDEQLLDDLHSVLDEGESDSNSNSANVIVLRGGTTTSPVFCSGLDFRAVTAATTTKQTNIAARFMALMRRLTSMEKIFIALVDGDVMGGGVGLVAACDFVYATKNATFALTEALWGLLPATVLPFLIRRIGFGNAYAMTLSTERVTAEAAREIHLVDEMVTTEASTFLDQKARSFARLSASTIRTTKTHFATMMMMMTPLNEQAEDFAVAETNRLLADPSIQQRLRDFTESGTLPWQSPSSTDDEVFEVVKAQILEVLGKDVPAASVRPEVSLTDLGASSLDRMEVVSLSMQALGLRFPTRELGKVSNIGELVQALHLKRAHRRE